MDGSLLAGLHLIYKVINVSKETALFLAGLVAAYHLAALAKDAEAVKVNLARYRRRKTGPNLRRLLLAEGALIADLGWLAG